MIWKPGAYSYCIMPYVGMSALHWAVDGGHEGIVHYALSEGVKVHVHLHLYTQGKIAMWYFYRQMMCLKTQLVHTLHFSRLVGNVYCYCTLHHALRLQIASVNGHASVARVLIEFGANVNQANSSGQTPLILAAVGGHAELARVLLEAGADLGVANPHGQTALDIATALEKKVILKILLVVYNTHTVVFVTCPLCLYHVEGGSHTGGVPATKSAR